MMDRSRTGTFGCRQGKLINEIKNQPRVPVGVFLFLHFRHFFCKFGLQVGNKD